MIREKLFTQYPLKLKNVKEDGIHSLIKSTQHKI